MAVAIEKLLGKSWVFLLWLASTTDMLLILYVWFSWFYFCPKSVSILAHCQNLMKYLLLTLRFEEYQRECKYDIT